jgi:hypothetical protein
MQSSELPVPSHFNKDRIGEIWRVHYQELAQDAERWAKQHHLRPAVEDRFRICPIPVMEIIIQHPPLNPLPSRDGMIFLTFTHFAFGKGLTINF